MQEMYRAFIFLTLLLLNGVCGYVFYAMGLMVQQIAIQCLFLRRFIVLLAFEFQLCILIPISPMLLCMHTHQMHCMYAFIYRFILNAFLFVDVFFSLHSWNSLVANVKSRARFYWSIPLSYAFDPIEIVRFRAPEMCVWFVRMELHRPNSIKCNQIEIKQQMNTTIE